MIINFDSQQFRNADEKALRLLPDVRICAIAEQDLRLACHKFRVSGSASVWYSVVFFEDERSRTNAICDCRAGRRGLHCYHVAAAFAFCSMFISRGFMPLFAKMKREASASFFFVFIPRFSASVCRVSFRVASPSRSRRDLLAMARTFAMFEAMRRGVSVYRCRVASAAPQFDFSIF